MGQGHSTSSNPLLEDWQRYPSQPNTFYNLTTNQKAISYLVTINKNQEIILRKRLQEQHNFITKILYFEPAEKVKPGIDQCKYYVYIQKTYPISAQRWVPVTSVLSILKGFRRLSSNYGMIRVTPNMIRVNDKKQIRVWINQNPLKSEPTIRVQSQQRMLADIVKIVMQYDSNTGALMMKCMTINQAINNILHNMTQNKSQSNFSNRTSKNEDKIKVTSKETFESTHPKINFRSTKQTQDDSLKIFHDSGHRNQIKKQIPILNQMESPKNLLQNVVVPKSPTYINVDRYQNDQRSNFITHKTETQGNISRDYNYSHQNNMQKQSSIQFNNSQPTKIITSCRPFKPVQYKNQHQMGSANNPSTISSQMSSGYERPHMQSQKYGEKVLQNFNKPSQLSYHAQRKSNLNRHFLERMETSQQSDMGSYPKGKGSIANERSEINTSREIIQTHPFSRPRLLDQNGGCFDSGRTKTQQFYSTNNERLGNSPRIRTNYIQSSSQMQKQLGHPIQVNVNIVKPVEQVNPLASQTMYVRAPESPKYSLQAERNDTMNSKKGQESNQEDQKRQTKLKQAQKIKEQMSGLGILSTSSPRPLANDKSARDLLIKQKIEQKNKKHQQLKCAITRLLSQ